MTTVFVSGASGFIAQHVVKQLIEKDYKVVGSVRSAAKGDQLKQDLDTPNFQYEIVEELSAPGAFDQALKKHPEVTVFLHTASPFRFDIEDIERDLLKPAIDGTKNALSSIKKYGPQVSKVVVTTSDIAMSYVNGDSSSPAITEDSWCDTTYEESLTNSFAGYRGSKTFAEKAAWEFVKQENPNFTLNTVAPTLVLGPQAFASGIRGTLNTSSEIINAVLKNGPDESTVPDINANFIDVRDVARAHLHAFESDVKNFRYLVVQSQFCLQYVLDALNKGIPSLKGKIPVGDGSKTEGLKSLPKVDNSRTRNLLGEFIPLEQSVVDSANQILNS
ncbi:putative NADPH-dependent methylglyoxal reductase Grp2p [[Candida] jaroonii]|uniref:NADPH-dependent methylglyoxal reductase Grp2p n=1 Tax=[Candida] jaroonii TaxID=467808 RepID=A0ACA9Y952_9ASCO|nr:putative NADPH-dependent methylglyoxal reductase Grp2p [[Candida] jaroonii]